MEFFSLILDEELKWQKALREKSLRLLKNAPDGTLRCRGRKEGTAFYSYEKNDRKAFERNITSDDKDRGDHELNEDGCCTVCGTNIYENIDGSFTVITYDNYGSTIANIEYDESREIYFFQRFENEYFEDGNPKTVKEYHYDAGMDEPGNERLVMEQEFLPCENSDNGDVYCAVSTTYGDTGKTVITSNEAGYALTLVEYDKNDEVVTETKMEYEFDDKGNLINQKDYTNGVISFENPHTYDEEGNLVEDTYIYYHEDGSVSETYTYDGEGNEIE